MLRNKISIIGQDGFTLIEMTVVLGCIVMLFILSNAVVTPKLVDIYEKDAYLKQLKKDIYYAQTFAIEKQTIVSFIIDTKTDKYFANSYSYGTFLKSEKAHSIQFKDMGMITITFNIIGNITSPTTIYLTDANGVNIYKLVFQLGRGRFYIKEIE